MKIKYLVIFNNTMKHILPIFSHIFLVSAEDFVTSVFALKSLCVFASFLCDPYKNVCKGIKTGSCSSGRKCATCAAEIKICS